MTHFSVLCYLCYFMIGELWANGQYQELLQEFYKTTDDGGYKGMS